MEDVDFVVHGGQLNDERMILNSTCRKECFLDKCGLEIARLGVLLPWPLTCRAILEHLNTTAQIYLATSSVHLERSRSNTLGRK